MIPPGTSSLIMTLSFLIKIWRLGITSHKQVLIYNIVTIPEDFRKMTTDLMAPIVINSENLKGRQVILQKGNYRIRHPFYREKVV